MMKLALACLALAALAHAQDLGEEKDSAMSKMMSGVKSMMEKQEDRMEEFKMFVKIMEFMKKGKEEDSKDFVEMFKKFAKMVWKMKNGGESIEDKEETSMEAMEKMMGGQSEEESEDEKMKKLFVLFMKFKDHYKKQKEMEEKKEAAERKFAMFQELCSFAKKAHAKKEILEKMGEMVEKKMKMKFTAFKACMMKGECEKGDDASEEDKSEEKSDNKHKELFEKMKEMMEKVSKKMMMEKLKEMKEGSSEDKMGGMSKMMKGMMGEEEEEETSEEDKDKKEKMLKALMKHLMEKGEKGFWDEDKDEDEKKMKKMFMAAKAMKMMKEMHEKMEKLKMAKMTGGMGSEEQEESSSEEKEEGDKLAMFSDFMTKMEKAKKMKEEFGDFLQWKKEKMMDEKKDAEKDMPTFIYFDVRARGEISRLIMEYGDLPIKQIRVNQSDWPALKPTMPFGQLPVLNISGMAFAQSLAIQKFLAIKAGLYPKSPKEQLITDMIANAREDLLVQEIRVAQEQNLTQQAILRSALPAAYDLYFGNFKELLENNPAGRNGLVLGDKLTLADLIIFEGSQTAFQTMPEILDKFPAIKALRAKVMATEGLMHYLVKRPKFDL